MASMVVIRRRRRTSSAPASLDRGTDTLQPVDPALSPPHDKLHVVWQVEEDLRWMRWVDYSVQHTRILEAAWGAMATEVELPAPWDTSSMAWAVSFVSMTQRNEWTGRTRRIRRMECTHS